jgi:hypothetical protein
MRNDLADDPIARKPRKRTTDPPRAGLFDRYRDALADNFRDTAAWRRKRRPPGERHLHAANALEAAALYTSYLQPCERLAPYVGLWQTPLGFEPWELLDRRLPSPSSFFFDTPGEPTANDIDRLIADTFTDVIDLWRAHLPATRLAEGGSVAFPTETAEVVEYFARRGRSLYRAWTGRELPR